MKSCRWGYLEKFAGLRTHSFYKRNDDQTSFPRTIILRVGDALGRVYGLRTSPCADDEDKVIRQIDLVEARLRCMSARCHPKTAQLRVENLKPDRFQKRRQIRPRVCEVAASRTDEDAWL